MRSDLKVLLLQIRDDELTSQEELYEFAQFGKLQVSQIETLNAFTEPNFPVSIVDDFDALFVGGSSDASVLAPHKYTFVENCKQLMQYCYDKDIPVFASCFGFQLAVEQFGGKVILDQENMEMGTYKISLSEAAKTDLLFKDISSPFWAISGHQERACELPKNAVHLAFSEACPYHGFRLENKPFYAFQFHPEVDRKDLITRITRYRERYLENEAALEQIIELAIHETQESNQLVEKFIDRILLTDHQPITS